MFWFGVGITIVVRAVLDVLGVVRIVAWWSVFWGGGMFVVSLVLSGLLPGGVASSSLFVVSLVSLVLSGLLPGGLSSGGGMFVESLVLSGLLPGGMSSGGGSMSLAPFKSAKLSAAIPLSRQ